jgi:hypothetical protein
VRVFFGSLFICRPHAEHERAASDARGAPTHKNLLVAHMRKHLLGERGNQHWCEEQHLGHAENA